MIVKFFKGRQGGSAKASIDYLRGKDREREQATVLKGNPDLSQSIAESLEFKNNYTVGCLSFEEPDLPMEQKREIMDKFEKTFFAGLDESQYNITWIEHLDKGRLELNYFIPNVELETNKRLQPYYDKADRHLADNFKKVINHEYGLTNPDDPDKSQLIKHDQRTPKPVKELKEGITLLVSKHIEQGTIKSQEQLAQLLTKSGLEVSRVTKNSVSIKNPSGGRNIRLDGAIYKKEFYEQTGSIEEFRRNFESGTGIAKSRDREDDLRDYEHAKEQLASAVARRAERHDDLYAHKNVLDICFDSPERDYSIRSTRSDYLREEVIERHSEAERNEAVIRGIRVIYSNKRDRNPTRREGRNIPNRREEENRDLRIDDRQKRHENRGLKGIVNELSRRTKEAIERTGRTILDVRARARRIFAFVRSADERKSGVTEITATIRNYNQEFISSDKEFRGRIAEREGIQKRCIDEIKGSFGERDPALERISNSFEQREQRATSINREIDRKTRALDRSADRGFSMGR